MKKMKNILVLMLFLFTMSINSYAGENAKGFYLGLGYGDVTFHDGGFSTNIYVNTGPIESKSNGMKVYTGYQFNNVIAIEASYTDFGKYSSKSNDNDFSISPKATSIYANLGYSFFDSQVRLFTTLGFASLAHNYDKHPNTLLVIEDETFSLKYGFGLAYEPNALHGVGFRVAFEQLAYNTTIKDDEDWFTLGSYNQSLTLIYLGVQYKF